MVGKESSEATPQTDTVTSSAPIVPTNDITVLRRSTRVSQQPERYGFLELTGQLDNDPKTYGEAMSDINSEKWIEATKSEMDSMSSNKVWTFIDPLKGVNGSTNVSLELTGRLLPSRPGLWRNVILKDRGSILRKPIHRSHDQVHLDYAFHSCMMDLKEAFLNGFVEGPEGFTSVGEEQKVYHLQRSIYGLK
ncbi:UNVERIFIED_CONTAM: hypothetical protein Sradi_6202700 [Sesamum radiatum]|uniref:Gag-pol polyprotein n=1 Tax=Sesamum radiatum TaxID=300843 RepID=A0AAW2K925_SESRA